MTVDLSNTYLDWAERNLALNGLDLDVREGSLYEPVAGEDFDLVFSPERVLTGRVFADLRKYPKLVGGLDEKSTKRAIDFYEQVLDFDDRPDLDTPNGVWDMGTAEAAEMAKLAETTYRDVNIAFANELSMIADVIGVDVWEVIRLANRHPRVNILQPGAGLNLARTGVDAGVDTAALNFRDFVLHVFPTSMVGAMAQTRLPMPNSTAPVSTPAAATTKAPISAPMASDAAFTSTNRARPTGATSRYLSVPWLASPAMASPASTETASCIGSRVEGISPIGPRSRLHAAVGTDGDGGVVEPGNG